MTTQRRVALVTGGSRGIGAAICRRLAHDGHLVHFAYREAGQAAKQVVAQIEEAGGSAWAHQADVADGNAVRALVDDIADQDGTVDILVNNAGVTDDQLL